MLKVVENILDQSEAMLVVGPSYFQSIDVIGQGYVCLDVVEVVADQVPNQRILHFQLALEVVYPILKSLNLSKLGSLHNHRIIGIVHPSLAYIFN